MVLFYPRGKATLQLLDANKNDKSWRWYTLYEIMVEPKLLKIIFTKVFNVLPTFSVQAITAAIVRKIMTVSVCSIFKAWCVSNNCDMNQKAESVNEAKYLVLKNSG